MEKTKEEKELFWSEIFIYHVNRFGGFDYKPVGQPTNSLIDIKGISKSGKYSELNLQLTWVEEIEFDPNRPVTTDLYFKKEPIEEAINRKNEKFCDKNGANIRDIILLLQGYMARIWAKDILTEEFCKQYGSSFFRGIYYLVRPATDSSGMEKPKDGEVLPIKPCFSF